LSCENPFKGWKETYTCREKIYLKKDYYLEYVMYSQNSIKKLKDYEVPNSNNTKCWQGYREAGEVKWYQQYGKQFGVF
jgi:hypothetical protein